MKRSWLIMIIILAVLALPSMGWAEKWQDADSFGGDSIKFINGSFMGVGGGYFYTSTNGKVWNQTQVDTPPGPDGEFWLKLNGLAYGNGTYVIAGFYDGFSGLKGGRLYKSVDGTTWTRTDEPLKGYITELYDVAYGNNTFVVVGDRYGVLTSPDGQSWTRNSIDIKKLHRVIFVNNTFVAVGLEGAIATSTDGRTWLRCNSGSTEDLHGIAFGENTYVAVGWKNTILTSHDLVHWLPQDSKTKNVSLQGVTYGKGVFVAGGDKETILSSPDGHNWSVEKQSEVYTYSSYGQGACDNNIIVIPGKKAVFSTGAFLPPISPVFAEAVAVSPNQINLTWKDKANNETAFIVWYREGDSGAWSTAATLPANTTEFSHQGLSSGRPYEYRVGAYNQYGYSKYTSDASAMTPFTGVGPLPVSGMMAPTGLSAKAVSASRIDLNWTDNAWQETGYVVWRREVDEDIIYTRVAVLGADATEYSDTGLPSGRTFEYKVGAFNPDIISSPYSNVASARTKIELGDQPSNKIVIPRDMITRKDIVIPQVMLPPAAPSGLAATIDGTAIQLTWTDNADNETGFKVERKVGNGFFIQAATIEADATDCLDSETVPGTSYTYRVKAFNERGDSEYSNQALVTVPQSSGNLISIEPRNPVPNLIIPDIPDLPEPPPATDDTATPEVNPTTEQNAGTGQSTTICLYLGQKSYEVNGKTLQMDAAPINRSGRTLLPIRYVADPLGANIDWDGGSGKATVTLGDQVIEVWLNQSGARINSRAVSIDPDNPTVTPVTVPPGRTMLPLRFVAEALGCDVVYSPTSKRVTVSYPAGH
ncbi:hypothetical protein SPSYN_02210 [Sporotomaculum syntrophicum]|uniref:Fibronectin type-III domain-containing protein n=1 Tax=Sporotomaculum syntrophicum TaxID=182264 RepID=A0A9D3AY59_9FIRM|nr:stalk domain-containing protein [Sporotomaculum syntrophicum]KAF1084433.1 hypothetical protein SPSYN_02210 [Sporotomaculum syntrophicum]